MPKPRKALLKLIKLSTEKRTKLPLHVLLIQSQQTKIFAATISPVTATLVIVVVTLAIVDLTIEIFATTRSLVS